MKTDGGLSFFLGGENSRTQSGLQVSALQRDMICPASFEAVGND